MVLPGITSNVVAPGHIGDTEGFNCNHQEVTACSGAMESYHLADGTSLRVLWSHSFPVQRPANYVSGEVLVAAGASWRVGYGPGHDFAYPASVLASPSVPIC